MLIVSFILVVFVLGCSIFLNYRLYTAYSSITEFFENMRSSVEENHAFFKKLSDTNLLMNDPFVVELITRLKNTRDEFDKYQEQIKSLNENK